MYVVGMRFSQIWSVLFEKTRVCKLSKKRNHGLECLQIFVLLPARAREKKKGSTAKKQRKEMRKRKKRPPPSQDERFWRFTRKSLWRGLQPMRPRALKSCRFRRCRISSRAVVVCGVEQQIQWSANKFEGILKLWKISLFAQRYYSAKCCLLNLQAM